MGKIAPVLISWYDITTDPFPNSVSPLSYMVLLIKSQSISTNSSLTILLTAAVMLWTGMCGVAKGKDQRFTSWTAPYEVILTCVLLSLRWSCRERTTWKTLSSYRQWYSPIALPSDCRILLLNVFFFKKSKLLVPMTLNIYLKICEQFLLKLQTAIKNWNKISTQRLA